MAIPYIERDVSWLSFNERVLQEAQDPDTPLYEKIKFLAIYSANLDEYFRVRISALKKFKRLDKNTRRALNIKPKRILKECLVKVEAQQERFGKIFREIVLPQLREEGINFILCNEFTDKQHKKVEEVFDGIRDKIEVYDLSWSKEWPAEFLKNHKLYFVIPKKDGENVSIVKIPSDECGRFYILPTQGENTYAVTLIDEVLRCNIYKLFSPGEITRPYSIKVSRDAEIYIDDEWEGNLLEKIMTGVNERYYGWPTRLLYDGEMPQDILDKLQDSLHIHKSEMIRGARYHNFNDFMDFPKPVKNEKLSFEPLPPLPHPRLEKADSLIEEIIKKDVMLHFPYQKFDYLPQLVKEAAEKDDVEEICITLYRTNRDSEITKALLKALGNGKKVFVFVEAKARFDEEINYSVGERLTEAGANVQFSFPGIKVHTKLILINRSVKSSHRHIAYIGTGNFNEITAKIYTDLGILTARQDIGFEVNQVIKVLKREAIIPRARHLLVSPFNLRSKFESLIDREISLARSGERAEIIAKMNSLEDREIIQKLYEASQAGVRIRLIVRGICCLQAGVEGFSENIEVISILDRFLEHPRIFYFYAGGEEKVFIASADWMSRNLDRRIEVGTPVYDEEIKERVKDLLEIQLLDNTKARVIDAEEKNKYVDGNGRKPVRAQRDTYYFFQDLCKPD